MTCRERLILLNLCNFNYTPQVSIMQESVEYCFKKKTFSNEFFAQLNELRKTGIFCDIILTSSDGEQFPVHRVVLAAGCMYFNMLFSTNMVEKQQTIVSFETVPSSALREILDYVYTGSVCVSKDSLPELIFASSMFLLFDLAEFCWDVFVQTLDLINCISRRILADSIGTTSIAKKVANFVLSNFVKIDFTSLASCPVTILHEVLASEELVVCRELEALGVLLKWFTSQDDAVEETVCDELLPLVRFKFIPLSREELVAFLQSFALSENSLIWNAVFERFQTNSGGTEARRSYRNVDVVIVAGGQGQSSVLNQVRVYVPATDQWFEIVPLHLPRRSFGLVSTDNFVYAIGGTMEKLANRPVSFIERYDPRKDAWEEIHVTSSHELERDNAGIVGLRDQIIISGGFSFTSCSLTASVVELYPSDGIWRELTPLQSAREGHVAIVDDVSIYVIGGKNQSRCLASVEKYDKEQETWQLLAPMNVSRAHACAVTYQKNLYIFGGYDGENVLNSVEVYNIKTNRWQLLSSGMAVARMKFALSLCGDEAFVIGGMTGSRGPMTADVEKYSFVNSTWTSVSAMYENKMELSCAKFSLPSRNIASLVTN